MDTLCDHTDTHMEVVISDIVVVLSLHHVFDWENAIALHAMQGNRASSLGEGEVSYAGFMTSRPLYL